MVPLPKFFIVHSLILSVLVLYSCGNNSSQNNSTKKITTQELSKHSEKIFYLELIDKADNGLSKKVIRIIEQKLAADIYFLNSYKNITKYPKNEKINDDYFNEKYKTIHRFMSADKINVSSNPKSNSVKIQVVYDTANENNIDEIILKVRAYCRQNRPEWWQCKDFGKFKFPTEDDIKKGKTKYTQDELTEAISQLILNLSFKENL